MESKDNDKDKAPTPREHATGYQRTVVIGDVHGDLDTLLRSLAAKKVLRYDGDVETVLRHVKASLKRTFSRNLESLLIRQQPRLQLIFVGDMVDRWPQGCHVIQFVTKVRWSRFGIDPTFLLGNHDVLNLHFFVNPYRIYEIYSESEIRM